jgi:hypothetical protein
MPDHRAAWLELEGVVSEGRGVVKQVARGLLHVSGDVAEVQWDDGRKSRWRIGEGQISESDPRMRYLVFNL